VKIDESENKEKTVKTWVLMMLKPENAKSPD